MYTVVITAINFADIHRYPVWYLWYYWYSDIEFAWEESVIIRSNHCIVETITNEGYNRNSEIVKTQKNNNNSYNNSKGIL